LPVVRIVIGRSSTAAGLRPLFIVAVADQSCQTRRSRVVAGDFRAVPIFGRVIGRQISVPVIFRRRAWAEFQADSADGIVKNVAAAACRAGTIVTASTSVTQF
jgi:hypothetical protein